MILLPKNKAIKTEVLILWYLTRTGTLSLSTHGEAVARIDHQVHSTPCLLSIPGRLYLQTGQMLLYFENASEDNT